MRVRAARGAIVVAPTTTPTLLAATERLLAAMLERNGDRAGRPRERLVHRTDDLRSAFPAEAARRMGLGLVPADVRPGDPRRRRRCRGRPASSLHFHSDRSSTDVAHVYLDGAESLRDDLDAERVAVIGTGLIGTSIAMAAVVPGTTSAGWDADPADAWRAPRTARRSRAGRRRSRTRVAGRRHRVRLHAGPVDRRPRGSGAGGRARGRRHRRRQRQGPRRREVVVDCRAPRTWPIRRRPSDGGLGALRPRARLRLGGRRHRVGADARPRRGGRPRSSGLEDWIERIGARPVRMDPARHDRLVAFVSHLPQVASTALMGLAATEEADEPEILLLAAGGFRDLTRLAASNPALWSEILLSNREAIAEAIDLYVERLRRPARPGRRGPRPRRRGGRSTTPRRARLTPRGQAAGAVRRGGAPGPGPRPAGRARPAHRGARRSAA